jgi:hypothetical protein
MSLNQTIAAIRALLSFPRARRRRKFLRYLGRLPGVRLPLLSVVRKVHAPEFGRLEPRERAVALLLMREATPLDELSASIAALPPPATARLFDEMFLQEAAEIAKRIGQGGYPEEAIQLLHVLQLISRLTGKESWTARIHDHVSDFAHHWTRVRFGA